MTREFVFIQQLRNVLSEQVLVFFIQLQLQRASTLTSSMYVRDVSSPTNLYPSKCLRLNVRCNIIFFDLRGFLLWILVPVVLQSRATKQIFLHFFLIHLSRLVRRLGYPVVRQQLIYILPHLSEVYACTHSESNKVILNPVFPCPLLHLEVIFSGSFSRCPGSSMIDFFVPSISLIIPSSICYIFISRFVFTSSRLNVASLLKTSAYVIRLTTP